MLQPARTEPGFVGPSGTFLPAASSAHRRAVCFTHSLAPPPRRPLLRLRPALRPGQVPVRPGRTAPCSWPLRPCSPWSSLGPSVWRRAPGLRLPWAPRRLCLSAVRGWLWPPRPRAGGSLFGPSVLPPPAESQVGGRTPRWAWRGAGWWEEHPPRTACTLGSPQASRTRPVTRSWMQLRGFACRVCWPAL